MQPNRLTTKPTHKVLAAIQAMDLESVKARLMDPDLGEGWTQEYADSIETAYRTYLSMLARYQEHAEDIMLAKDVDEFWHTHILQTMKYADDCRNVFGAFLHHNPHVGRRTTEDMERRAASAETTRRLYAKEYGDRSDRMWSGSVGPEGAAYSSAAVDAVSAAYPVRPSVNRPQPVPAQRLQAAMPPIRARPYASGMRRIPAQRSQRRARLIRAPPWLAERSASAVAERGGALPPYFVPKLRYTRPRNRLMA